MPQFSTAHVSAADLVREASSSGYLPPVPGRKGRHRAKTPSNRTGVAAAIAAGTMVVAGIGAAGQAAADPVQDAVDSLTHPAALQPPPGLPPLPPEVQAGIDAGSDQLNQWQRDLEAAVNPNVHHTVKPVSGVVTSGFGSRWGANHYGVDIANGIGTPIHSVSDGTVIEAGPASGFGLWVRVRHDDGTTAVYGHVNDILSQVGQRVTAGTPIATIGNRGQSTGPHLHLEIWDSNGRKIDPVPWLAARGVSLGSGANA